MFDTLKYTNGAMKAGYTREQAEYQAAEMASLIEEALAKKEDLQHLEISLKKDIEKIKNDLIIKLGGLMVICSSAIIAVLGLIIKI